MRLRRLYSENNVRNFVQQELTADIIKLMSNRRRLLAPFPIDPMDIYDAVWTDEERHAMKVLSKHDDLVNDGTVMRLPMVLGNKSVTCMVTLPRKMSMQRYSFEIGYTKLPEAFQYQLAEWAEKWMQLYQQQKDLVAKVKDVGGACRTFGQLYRLWPDILSLMSKAGQRKVAASRAKSSLPASMYMPVSHDANAKRVLYEEYRPEAFAPFTDMIAECLMLSVSTDDEIATIVT